MAQIQTITWTNANPAVARNQSVGFEIAQITTIDTTNGGSWTWVAGMADASYLDVDAGTVTASNGFTPLEQSAIIGPVITGFTNDNPGVISATGIADAGVAAGDTIKVQNIADDLTGTSLNGEYTVASVTATTITTETNTTSYSAWVSGGTVTRVSDSAGEPVSNENLAIRGGTIGTGMVGAASAAMVAIVVGKEPVT